MINNMHKPQHINFYSFYFLWFNKKKCVFILYRVYAKVTCPFTEFLKTLFEGAFNYYMYHKREEKEEGFLLL